jgi:sortase (surface protein transpeptidase)
MTKAQYIAIAAVTLGAALLFGITFYRAFYGSGELPGIGGPAAALESSPATVPVELQIPSLTIDAKVQQVGLTKSGAIGIPSNFTDVAWYKYGPVPGAAGNAIIDGHVDNAVSLPGVFKHLDRLAPGDAIYIVNASGTRLHFIVTKKESLPYNATATEDVFAKGPAANLVLITCGGTWIQSIKQYSERFVVFSTLAP